VKRYQKVLVVLALVVLISLGVYSNYVEKISIDRAKIPRFVEDHKNFQKWITNHKNKDIELEADAFRLLEESEVYNTQRLKLYPLNDARMLKKYNELFKAQEKVVDKRFSPDGKQFVNYQYDYRLGLSSTTYLPSDVWYLGIRGDRIIENKLISCNTKANCIVDRAFFISDDIIVVSEIMRDIDTDKPYAPCGIDELCAYRVRLNVMDIAQNSNLIYESPSFDIVLSDKIEGF
jgi:hypothetical protein